MPARRVLVPAAAVAALAAVIAIPATRASAQAFLDLFRVVNVAAVPVNGDRLKQLSDRGLDVGALIGSQTQLVQAAGPAQVFQSPADAGRAAGLDVRLPSVVPPNLVLVRTELRGEHIARVTADAAKLREVLDALAIDDVDVPASLDGKTATIRVPPMVKAAYANGADEISFVQARSPEISLPSGIDVATLGEIALRVAGMSAADAHTMAQAIDWRSTLLVPIPAGAATFRQVTVAGERGLLVDSGTRRGPRGVFWTARGNVYAMTGGPSSQTLLQMAESVQ